MAVQASVLDAGPSTQSTAPKAFYTAAGNVIALALVVDGSVQMSVIGCPRLSVIQADGAVTIGALAAQGGIAIAVRGHGALVEPG